MNFKKKVNIEDLKLTELSNFQKFLKNNFEKKHIFSNKNKIIYFQHLKKNKKRFNFKVVKFNNKIVAVHGYIPLYKFDNKLSKKQIFLSFLYSKPMLKFPIFPLTLRKILEKNNFDFVGSVGINKQLIPFHKSQGFKINKMNHHVFLAEKIKKYKIANVPKKIKNKLIKKNNKFKYYKLSENFLKKNAFRKIFSYQVPIKSNDYLINRYLKHPIYNYLIYGVFNKSKSLKLIFVLRKINIKNSKIYKMVDLLGNEKDLPKIKYALSNIIDKNKAEYIDLYSFGLSNFALKKASFINVNKIKKLIIPNYFEPFRKENIDIICGYKSRFINKVRIFRGDSDQDQPRLIN